LVSVLNGSPLYQVSLNNKFGALRDGIKQPNLDNFTHNSLLYTIKEKKPDITFVHYTDLDTMRHYYGFNSKEAKEAIRRHDSRLGDIIKTLKVNDMYEDNTVIVLGDHSSLDEDKIINLNILLKENGYIQVDDSGKIINYKAIIKNCDGSAYLYVKDTQNKTLIREVRELIENFNNKYKCIEVIYSSDEAKDLGADPQCALMLEANKGYYFLDNIEGEIIKKIHPHEVGKIHNFTSSTHGYSPFKEDYTTVFFAAGCGIKKGVEIEKMNLIDEAPTMAKLLGLELKNVDGRIVEEFFV
jgi:predicted AlkP superfamily pyrophosphatase or phosphodiesterase